MLAFKQTRFASHVEPFRWLARASSIVLFVLWLSYFLVEIPRTPLHDHGAGTLAQAGALAMIFAGFVVGWRWELAGGLTALAGTLVFFYAVNATSFAVPGPAMLLFALPGVLFLLAWQCETPHPVQ